jgi:hypothetical protein
VTPRSVGICSFIGGYRASDTLLANSLNSGLLELVRSSVKMIFIFNSDSNFFVTTTGDVVVVGPAVVLRASVVVVGTLVVLVEAVVVVVGSLVVLVEAVVVVVGSLVVVVEAVVVVVGTLVVVVTSAVQFKPVLSYPGLQLQLYPPIVLTQYAFSVQLYPFVTLHSLISVQFKPVPSYPSLQLQLYPPIVLTQCALSVQL